MITCRPSYVSLDHWSLPLCTRWACGGESREIKLVNLTEWRSQIVSLEHGFSKIWPIIINVHIANGAYSESANKACVPWLGGPCVPWLGGPYALWLGGPCITQVPEFGFCHFLVMQSNIFTNEIYKVVWWTFRCNVFTRDRFYYKMTGLFSVRWLVEIPLTCPNISRYHPGDCRIPILRVVSLRDCNPRGKNCTIVIQI